LVGGDGIDGAEVVVERDLGVERRREVHSNRPVRCVRVRDNAHIVKEVESGVEVVEVVSVEVSHVDNVR